MSALFNQILLNWVDKNGQPAVTFWGAQDQTSGPAANYGALVAATQALSDARITHIQFQSTLSLGGAPVDGDYCTVFDRAQFLARYAGIRRVQQFAIPGPKASIFLPNHELVDMANPLVVAWNAQMALAVGTPTGQAYETAIKGVRGRAGGD